MQKVSIVCTAQSFDTAGFGATRKRHHAVMKVCIVGAGAIGGFIGTRLAAAGQAEVSALARGATLAALQRNGWWLEAGGQVTQAPVVAREHAAELGPQDLVVIAVKGPSMPGLAASLAPLLHEHTSVLPAVNGVPWWFQAATPALAGAPLQAVDPGGQVLAALPLRRVIGCVVHASTTAPAPGRVLHKNGQRLILGEPLGGRSHRVDQVAALLSGAGFDVPISPHIRCELWYKLWGNMTMNPVSALTGATVDHILGDAQLRGFCSAVMREAAALGALIDCAIDEQPDDRHAVTLQLGAFKTSMLQDAEAGRPLELDALVTVVREIAQRLNHPTPFLDGLLGLARVFAQRRRLYPL